MPVPVIVIQTSYSGRDSALKWLTRVELEQGTDFVLWDSDSGWPEELLAREGPQLIVTGTIHGDERPVVEFVRRIKERNPQLEVWFFSVMPPLYGQEIYNRVIERPPFPQSRYEVLADAIKEHLGK